MPRAVVFTILIIICASAFAQASFMDNLGKPVFDNKILYAPSDNDSTTDIGVYLSVFSTGLQFIRQRPFYRAEFDVLIVLYSGDELVAKLGVRDSIIVEGYSETNSRDVAADVVYTLGRIPPGEYRILISVLDIESKEKFSKEAEIKVPIFNGVSSVALGPVILFDSRGRHRENYSVYPVGDSVFFGTTIAVNPPESVDIVIAIEKGDSVIAADTLFAVSKYTRLRAAMPLSSGLGAFRLTTAALDDGVTIARVYRDVVLSGKNAYRIAVDPAEAVEQLSLIESGSELKALRNALKNIPESVDSLIEVFWAEKDPTPSTDFNELREEFDRRVALANVRFRESRQGWRSDRGRVLIVYGEPDEVESHPFDMGYLAYEIWYYNNPRRTFYFEDRHSDGTYELIRQE